MNPALLLLLPEVFAESTIFGSALGLGWLLVVAFVQVGYAKIVLFLLSVSCLG